MKSRGVYETPGGSILYKAHNVLETITLDKESFHFKDIIAQKMGEIVYNGQWYTPLREAICAFTDELQKTVTGDVTLKLYKGNMINAGVTSPYTLYDEQTASFGEDDDYDQADSAGFINLFGLPSPSAPSWPKSGRRSKSGCKARFRDEGGLPAGKHYGWRKVRRLPSAFAYGPMIFIGPEPAVDCRFRLCCPFALPYDPA